MARLAIAQTDPSSDAQRLAAENNGAFEINPAALFADPDLNRRMGLLPDVDTNSDVVAEIMGQSPEGEVLTGNGAKLFENGKNTAGVQRALASGNITPVNTALANDRNSPIWQRKERERNREFNAAMNYLVQASIISDTLFNERYTQKFEKARHKAYETFENQDVREILDPKLEALGIDPDKIYMVEEGAEMSGIHDAFLLGIDGLIEKHGGDASKVTMDELRGLKENTLWGDSWQIETAQENNPYNIPPVTLNSAASFTAYLTEEPAQITYGFNAANENEDLTSANNAPETPGLSSTVNQTPIMDRIDKLRDGPSAPLMNGQQSSMSSSMMSLGG
jgi:hypothetical protein